MRTRRRFIGEALATTVNLAIFGGCKRKPRKEVTKYVIPSDFSLPSISDMSIRTVLELQQDRPYIGRENVRDVLLDYNHLEEIINNGSKSGRGDPIDPSLVNIFTIKEGKGKPSNAILIPTRSKEIHYILTPYHCLEEGSDAHIFGTDSEGAPTVHSYGGLLAYSKGADLALGWCWSQPLDLPTPRFDLNPNKDDLIQVRGRTKDGFALEEGEILYNDKHRILTDVKQTRGDSGKALTKDNRIVGIISWILEEQDNLAIALNSRSILDFLRKYSNYAKRYR